MKTLTYKLFVFSALLLLVCCTILFIERTADNTATAFMVKEVSRLKDKAAIAAKFTAAFVDEEFDALIAVESPDFIAAPLAKQQELLDIIAIAGPYKYIDLILVNPSGKTFWSLSGKALKDYSGNELFSRAQSKLSSHIVEHTPGLPPIYLVAKPIIKDGSLKSVVIMRLNMAKLSEILKNLAIPYDNIFVADENGIIISDTLGLAAAKTSIKIPWDVLNASEDENFDASCDSCAETLSRQAPVSTLGWNVYTTTNQKPFYAKLTSAIRTRMWVITLAAAVSVWLIMLISKERWSKFYEWGHRRRRRHPHW